MAENKATYEEISKASISDARNVVISKCSKGGYTLAQQTIFTEGKNEIAMFMKGAIHIKDIDALKRVRDAINIAISTIEDETADWD